MIEDFGFLVGQEQEAPALAVAAFLDLFAANSESSQRSSNLSIAFVDSFDC